MITLEQSGQTPESALHFPMLRWVEPGFHYKIPLYDTFLSQYDPFVQHRRDELERSRKIYKFAKPKPNLPIEVKLQF